MNSVEQLNQQTNRLLAELAGWPPEQMRFRRSSTEWSIIDVLDHLVLTESSILANMRKNLAGSQVIPLSDRFRHPMVNCVMLLPLKVAAPSGAKMVLPCGRQAEFTQIREEWQLERTRLADFVNGLLPADSRKGLFKHPVAGWTNANGALRFLRCHLHHHRYQISRIKKAFPNAPGLTAKLV